ncbi:hypothetical protein L1887_00304 [Cichorium endivia]|nr:hypothetical protein L1887_00304 [Cichorium endivia]
MAKFRILVVVVRWSLRRKSVTRDGPYASRILATEPLESSSLEEAWIAPLLSSSNLLITRDIIWANITLGFQQ